MIVEQLCRDFADDGGISLGETPALAYDRCWELSLAFSWYCRGRGEKAVMLRVEHPIKKITNPKIVDERELISHFVVDFPDHEQVVDWTARQFWPRAKHPLILDRLKLALYWGIIDP